MPIASIAFRDLITVYSCQEGVEFCENHGWDYFHIMANAHEYRSDIYGPNNIAEAREEVLLGLRVSLVEARRISCHHWSYVALRAYSQNSDLTDPDVWGKITILYRDFLRDMGVWGSCLN